MSLEVGDKAPLIEGVDQNGAVVEHQALLGRKVALYFYPKDDTPGCTKEACSLRDGYAELQQAGYEVIGVSPDPVAKHKKFEEKYELPFRLIADTERKVIEAYGIWGLKKFMGREYMGVNRKTFIIDEHGKIERIIEKVKTKEHAAQILEAE